MKVLTSKYEYLGFDENFRMHMFRVKGDKGLELYPECKWVKAKSLVYMCFANGRIEPTHATTRQQEIYANHVDMKRTYL